VFKLPGRTPVKATSNTYVYEYPIKPA
jgi:hypothetical protein